MKRILITGANGYIGSKITQKLISKGFQIIAVDKSSMPSDNIKDLQNLEYRQADLRNPTDAEKVICGADIVLHLAANIGSLTYMEDFQADILRDNLLIDSILYPQLIKAGIKNIVYSSSSMVFQNSTVFPYTEEDLKRTYLPTNIYGFSKLSGEYFCRAFNAQNGLQYVVLRYHNLYGPGEKAKGTSPGDIHVIPALIQKVISGQYPLEILGNPNSTRPFTYADDAVDATVLLVEAALECNPKVINNDFNIGSERSVTILELAELIWKITGSERAFQYTTKTTTANSADRREINAKKIYDAIGWKASTPLEVGVKHVYESLI